MITMTNDTAPAADIVTIMSKLAAATACLDRWARELERAQETGTPIDTRGPILITVGVAEAVIPLLPEGESRPALAIDAVWEVIGDPSEGNRKAALEAAFAAFSAALDYPESSAAEAAADAAAHAARAAGKTIPGDVFTEAAAALVAAKAAVRAASENIQD